MLVGTSVSVGCTANDGDDSVGTSNSSAGLEYCDGDTEGGGLTVGSRDDDGSSVEKLSPAWVGGIEMKECVGTFDVVGASLLVGGSVVTVGLADCDDNTDGTSVSIGLVESDGDNDGAVVSINCSASEGDTDVALGSLGCTDTDGENVGTCLSVGSTRENDGNTEGPCVTFD